MSEDGGSRDFFSLIYSKQAIITIVIFVGFLILIMQLE